MLRASGAVTHGSPSTLNTVLSFLTGGLDRAVASTTQMVFAGTIFKPFVLTPAAVQLFDFSRNLALGASSLFLLWAILQMMWPELSPGTFLSSPTVVVHRALTQALWTLAAVPAVQMLIALNNAVVAAFDSVAIPADFAEGSALGMLTDPVAVTIMLLAIFILTLLLGVFYTVRNLEIVVLMALIPWFALIWMAHVGDATLRKLVKELVVAIFVQSVHALVFYLFLRVMATQSGTVAGQMMIVALLWYMLKIPQQLRRIVGAVGPGGLV